MCDSCWREYGSPKIDTVKTRAAAEAVKTLYDCNFLGGFMHIVVDDWNLATNHIEWCLGIAQEQNDDYAHLNTPGAREASLQVGRLFLGLNEKERAAALGLADGFWNVDEEAR